MSHPRKGQRFRTREDLDVVGVISFKAPASGGFSGRLPQGTTVTVEDDPPPFARGVYVRPNEYERFERIFVSESDRRDEKYSGYAVVIGFDALAEFFETVGNSG